MIDKRNVDANKTITCCKCHGNGFYQVPIDPDYSWDECETVKCELCRGTGKLELEFYEELQRRCRNGKVGE